MVVTCLYAISLASMNLSKQLLRHVSCGLVTLLDTAVALGVELRFGVPLWTHIRKHLECAESNI